MSRPQCDTPDGILGYRNECLFAKVAGDDANPVTAPDIIEPEQNGQTAETSTSTGFGAQAWLATDPQLTSHDGTSGQSLPIQNTVLTPNSGPMPGFVQSESGGENTDLSPDGVQSNRPTPNSSSASEQRQGMASGAGTAGLNASGGNSYDASPVTANQNLSGQNGVEGNNFFDPSFGISGAGMTPGGRFSIPPTPANDFTVPTGWADLSGQTGMTPVAEGVLRSLMNMGPMDAMDLSSWESGN